MRLIHCADIHLGCVQFGLQQRFDDFGNAFKHIVDYTLSSHADGMLLAGDFFHHRAINAATLSLAVALLEPLAEAHIPVYIIEGNHDKAYYNEGESWLSFLHRRGLVHLLGIEAEDAQAQLLDESFCAHLKGCRIIGLGYLSASTRRVLERLSEQLPDDGVPTILMLHAAVDKLMSAEMAGVSSRVLAPLRERVDYIALGHIHGRQEVDHWAFTPGAPESVHIDEIRDGREKGFYDVEIGAKELRVTFIPSRHRPVYHLEVDVQGIQQPQQAAQQVAEKAAAMEMPPMSILQVRMTGCPIFQPVQLQLPLLAEQIGHDNGCLHVQIDPPQAREDIPAEHLDRADIEREVLSELAAQERPQWLAHQALLTEMLISGHRSLEEGIASDALIDWLDQHVPQDGWNG